jgi:D-glycero-beta-D-manno-heptose-7-phosphate kinase
LNQRLVNILNGFDKKEIAVIGDFMLDRYFVGNAERISPEAPVPVVLISEEKSTLGGAGNVVENLNSLGVKVDPYGIIGNDNNGDELLAKLKLENIDISHLLLCNKKKTTVKTRIIADKQQMLRYDIELIEPLSEELEKKIIEQLGRNIERYDAIILSDYAKGVFSNNLAPQIIQLATKNHKKVIADPKPINIEKFIGATAITPNLKEAALVLNKTTAKTTDDIRSLGKDLLLKLKLDHLIITLGADGIYFISKNKNFISPTNAKEIIDVTGAGDTVISIYTLALISGSNEMDAVLLANLAGGIVVSKSGSAKVTREDVINVLLQKK